MFQTESEFVRWLSRLRRPRDRRVRLGIGDDAALVRMTGTSELILTTDLSVEGIHFDQEIHPPQSVGHRALARSLSDVAAMGGTPRFALVSLVISKRVTRDWISRFYSGMYSLARRFQVSVIGGDTAVAPGAITVDVTVIGEVRHGSALRRSGARPGDLLFVSGRLGLAELGLRLLKSRWGRSSSASVSYDSRTVSQGVRAHLYPEPRCALGRHISGHRLASAMIDISDGLSSDLIRLAQASGVGARVRADWIPAPAVSPAEESLKLALRGGEDYELLFAVPRSKAASLPESFQAVPIHQVGEICQGNKPVLLRADGSALRLRASGYDHFRKI